MGSIPSARIRSAMLAALRLPAIRRAISAIVAVVVLALPAGSFAQGPLLLSPRVDIAVGTEPQGIATGDFNGDGKPDLAVANSLSNTASVLLGDGTGGFGPRTDLATGAYPIAVAIADVNGDGRADLLVANYSYPSTVSVFLGNGAGGFAPRMDSPIPAGPMNLALGDLNSDGKPDLALAFQGFPNNVAVLAGNGTGGFGAATLFLVGINPVSLAIGDMNGDGKPDLVVGNHFSQSVSVLLGDGSGGFAPHTDFAAGSGLNSVSLGDLNNDGKLDVVVANMGILSSSVGVFLGDGLGGLGSMTSFTIGSDTRPASVVIGDVNGDGKPDVVAALSHSSPNGVEVLLGDGTGSFALGGFFPTAASPIAIAAADFNSDGQLDFAVADSASDSISVLFGNAKGLFATKLDYPTVGGASRAATGDFNLDGRPDLALGSAGTVSTVSVLLGSASGEFTPPTTFGTGLNPLSVAVGDLNGDGLPDLVAANFTPSTVSVLLGNGAGSFQPKVDYVTGLNPYSVAIGDFNGDGRADLAVADVNLASVSVLLGGGGGGFLPKTDYVVGTTPWAVAVGDLNGDGNLDLVTTNGGSNTVSVLLGNGAGGFASRTDFPTGTNPNSVAIGDLNGDGKPDLAVCDNGYPPFGFSVLLGNGLGGFAPRIDYQVGAYPDDVAIGDVNGDGRNDVVVANSYYSAASVLLGNGQGGFAGYVDYPTSASPTGVELADFNGDGRLDIGAACGTGASFLRSLVRTRTSLSASPGSAVLGAPMTLTANVSVPAPGAGVPAGTVSFFDGFTLLGTSPVNGGVAGLALFAPYLGNRTLSAAFNGDAKYQRSVSPPQLARVVTTAKPAVAAIRDIANDQGRQVRVEFLACAFDAPGSATPVTQYELYRQVNPALGPALVRPAPTAGPAGVQVDGADFVGLVTAHDLSAYDLVVPTLADSNGSGFHRAVFFVRAATSSPYVYFDSPPDSGYSVDNIPPALPTPFLGVYSGGATHLHWGANLEPDLWYYRVYRGGSAGFVPGPANLVATRPDTGYADTGAPGSYYKLSAVDVNGNESGYAVLGPGGTLGVPGDAPLAFALEGARPNPVRGPGLLVRFSLPGPAAARLELVDVGGRRVALREVGGLGAGRHTLDLAPDLALSPGLYLLRLTQGSNARTTRVVVLP